MPALPPIKPDPQPLAPPPPAPNVPVPPSSTPVTAVAQAALAAPANPAGTTLAGPAPSTPLIVPPLLLSPLGVPMSPLGTPLSPVGGSSSPKSSPVPPNVPSVKQVKDLSQYDHEDLLKFYRGDLANVLGVTLKEMQNFSFEEKEKKHLYIQWMWPLKEISKTQPGAKGPILTDEFIQKLRQDTECVKQAKESFKSMLEFYGLQYDGTAITKGPYFDILAKNWCPGGYDHNHARISRMIESLQYFGLDAEALAFFNCLKQLWVELPSRFDDDTVENWCGKIGQPWNEVQNLLSTIVEEREIEFTLDNLILAKKKTHWITADLTVEESSWFGRVMWAIIKYCKCLRSLFYDIDTEKARQRWNELTIKIIGNENPRLRKLIKKWRAAGANMDLLLAEKKKFKNLMVAVKPGDISKEPADVIVNAANERLLGGSGVDHDIHKAGGPEILEACKQIREARKQANRPEDSQPSEAVTTIAGKLPAKNVVHTVGPRWKDGKHNEEELLYKSYANSLDQAARRKSKSVNFPSLSTGVFGFPLEKAAPKMVQAMKDFAGKKSSVQKVKMVVYWPEDYIAYSNALKA